MTLRDLEVHTKMNMVIDFYLFLVEEQRGHCTVKDKKKGVQKDRSLLFLKKLFVD